MFAALLFAAALRIRGKGGIPPQGGGWRELSGPTCTDVRAAVIGLGAVGARAARQLISTPDVDEVFVFDSDPVRLAEVGTALGERSVPLAGPEVGGHGVSVVVLATPSGEQLDAARGTSSVVIMSFR